jgi:hypothetical protein
MTDEKIVIHRIRAKYEPFIFAHSLLANLPPTKTLAETMGRAGLVLGITPLSVTRNATGPTVPNELRFGR